MKAHQKSSKKLVLKKSTIAHLIEDEMSMIKGGSYYTLSCGSICTCPSGGGSGSRNYCAN